MAEDTKQIVRLMRRDLPGEVPIEVALRELTGINFMTARAIRIKSGFDEKLLIGDMTDEEMNTLENMLEDLRTLDLPKWLINRRKDPETGIDNHLVETNLIIANREDLANMKKMKSRHGIRHILGLTVRGQRTKATGRKNKTIGVQRKGAVQAGSASAAASKPAGKPAAAKAAK